jgi:two-component system NtrC family sensor kinase
MLERQLFQARKLESIGQIAAGVAHEVRNPLNAILSITEALFKDMEIEGNPDYDPYIKHIRTQVSRLARLMNDLLDLGKPIPVTCLNPVFIHEFCRDNIELWNSSNQEIKIAVRLDAGYDVSNLIVFADSVRLQQVLFNLLDNAAQHSSSKSSILIQLGLAETIQENHSMAALKVIDSGRGIPDNAISRIFDPFYTDRKEGTGLGLALVRHFMTNMGGSVVIYNNDPPPGCTAEIRIPLATKELT